MDWWMAVFALAALIGLAIPVWDLWRLEVTPRLVRMPVPGEFWAFKERTNGDPWEVEKRGHRVEVLDVREGWVRYRFANQGSLFQDERMKADSFRYCYEPTNGA